MTVFMLRSYCEQKELYRTVTVPANQNGKPRIVVFDAPGALKSFLRPAKRGLLYDFHQQQQKVHNMVRAFKQQGYELVVFLDCNIPDDKLTTWYRRRAVEASTLRKLNQQLSAEPAKSVPDALWLPPNGGLQMLGDAFAKAGCKVFYSFDDSDKEASYWAKVNGAYAIITDDTDFMCYEGVERIWSGQLKLPGGRNNQIRVSELSRPRLLDSLGLNQVQLQQLAGLLGNDHIKHIARDKIQQLKEQHPNEHVCSVLARQVLELQPALGFPAVPIPPAPQADAEVIDPAVKQAVSAAIAAIGGKTAEDTAQECLPLEEQPAAVTGNTAERKIGEDAAQVEAPAEDSAADHAAGDADEGDDVEEDYSNEDAEFKGEEEHADEEDEAAAEPEPLSAEAATSSETAAATATSTTSLVDRCKRAMAQYGCTNVQTPVTVGSGDRWLLLNKGILMRGVAVEDMSRTPCHVLLQPLRLAVYASLGLSSVTEYLCVPDEKWKEWAAGRLVNVPALPPLQAKDRRDNRRRKAGAADIDPVVKRVVAAAISNVVAAEGDTTAAVTDSEPATETSAKADVDAQQPTADEIDPAVKKLVATVFSNVITAASRAYEPLPRNLPTKPYELVSFICKRIRALDPSGEQFSRRHEKLLLLQLTHRQGVLAAARAARLRTNTVRLPDLHAANLFLQAYCALQIVQDGKLPKIANLFNVEAFHALCQHKQLVKKAEESPRDFEAGRDANRGEAGSSRQGQHAGALGGRGLGPKTRGTGAPMVNRPPGAGLMQAGRLFKAGFGMQQPGRGAQQHEGGRGRRGEFQQGGRTPYQHQQQQQGYVAAAGTGPVRGRGVREGYQPYSAGGISGVRQQRGEQLTWQQRQQQGSARGGHGGHAQQQTPYQQHAGYQQQAEGAYQGYEQYGYQQYGGGYQGYGGYQQYGNYQQSYGGQSSSYAGQQAYGQSGSGRGAGGYNAGYGAGPAAAGYQGHAVYQQQGYQQQYQSQYGGGRGGNRQQHQSNGGDTMTWQQQQILGRRPGRGGRDGGAAGGY